jgi:endonuclease YncB( thermonuclease family)
MVVDRRGRGQVVTLTTDAAAGLLDARGHVLAYAQTSGGDQLQLAVLGRGWAKAQRGRHRLARRFASAQARARKARRGLWRACRRS